MCSFSIRLFKYHRKWSLHKFKTDVTTTNSERQSTTRMRAPEKEGGICVKQMFWTLLRFFNAYTNSRDVLTKLAEWTYFDSTPACLDPLLYIPFSRWLLRNDFYTKAKCNYGFTITLKYKFVFIVNGYFQIAFSRKRILLYSPTYGKLIWKMKFSQPVQQITVCHQCPGQIYCSVRECIKRPNTSRVRPCSNPDQLNLQHERRLKL